MITVFKTSHGYFEKGHFERSFFEIGPFEFDNFKNRLKICIIRLKICIESIKNMFIRKL